MCIGGVDLDIRVLREAIRTTISVMDRADYRRWARLIRWSWLSETVLSCNHFIVPGFSMNNLVNLHVFYQNNIETPESSILGD